MMYARCSSFARSLTWVALVTAGALGACASDSKGRSGGHGALGGEAGDGDLSTDESPSNMSEGDGNDGAGKDPGPDACADVVTTPVRTIPSVVFLVDGSSSMECVYPEDPECSCDAATDPEDPDPCIQKGNKTRWQALSEALVGTASEAGLIASLSSAIRFGLWIYNDNPLTPTCPGFPTKVAPALDQAQALTAAFPAKPPGYNTPTGLAMSALVAALPGPDERDQMKLGPQRIVLATDGEPFACVDRATRRQPPLDYQSVLHATAEADAKDIDVYVMSLAPTSGDFAAHLQEVAVGGHTGQPYSPVDRGQLSAALNAIIEDAISCTVEIQGEINDPGSCKGKAHLGDTTLLCGEPNGFSILDAQHVRLEGTACERFKREPGIELSMSFPCFQLQ